MAWIAKIAVILDSTPVGILTNTKNRTAYRDAHRWLQALLNAGVAVYLSEIAYYEVLRELIRIGSQRGINELNDLARRVTYIPIQTLHIEGAARMWGYGRQIGIMTAGDDSWDADLILAAQAQELEERGMAVIIATGNVRHLDDFADARLWYDLTV